MVPQSQSAWGGGMETEEKIKNRRTGVMESKAENLSWSGTDWATETEMQIWVVYVKALVPVRQSSRGRTKGRGGGVNRRGAVVAAEPQMQLWIKGITV